MADETKQKIIIPRKGIATGENRVRGLNSPLMNTLATKLGGEDGKTISRASNVDVTADLTENAKLYLARYHEWAVRQVMDITIVPPADFADDQLLRTFDGLSKLRNCWWADLLPVNGPVLGPFVGVDGREQALAAEEKWLHEHHIPVCVPCRE